MPPTIFRSLVLTAVLAMPAAALAQAPARTAPVDIILLSDVRADGPVIRLGHVAQLVGGETLVREALANLDLAEFRRTEIGLTLTRADVKFRLLVAGHDARSFRIAGAAQCRVKRSSGALTEAAVVHAARQMLQEQVAAVAQPLSIDPVGPVLIPALEMGPQAKVLLHADLTPTRITVGATPVDVHIVVNGQARGTVRAWFEVQPTTQTAVRLGFTQAPDHETRPADNPIVIHARDRVRMRARVGESEVLAAGEAMEDGRAGQSIRMRNVDSNKTVLGRVLGPGLVEVEY
jgi:hypothetical protein